MKLLGVGWKFGNLDMNTRGKPPNASNWTIRYPLMRAFKKGKINEDAYFKKCADAIEHIWCKMECHLDKKDES